MIALPPLLFSLQEPRHVYREEVYSWVAYTPPSIVVKSESLMRLRLSFLALLNIIVMHDFCDGVTDWTMMINTAAFDWIASCLRPLWY